ncbi:MAG: hypothetical protein M5U14_12780 [Acidimicrobiia bacterium]|nr:hypothetical protein [Acidimicrobiia bacterium]
MRPYPDEILRSMRDTLDQSIIPNLRDQWAVYAAKVMDKMMEHLEIRWRREAPLLAEDTEDLLGVLSGLRDALGGPALAGHDGLAGLRGRVDAGVAEAVDRPADPTSIVSLTEHNEALRRLVVDAIEAMDAAAAAEPGLGEVLAAPREDIRCYLRRELDRDVELARPTFMSFAPPKPKKAGAKG